jgi:hypothetical protein
VGADAHITQPSFAASKPQVLFESSLYAKISRTANYDVPPDGLRFLMIHASE